MKKPAQAPFLCAAAMAQVAIALASVALLGGLLLAGCDKSPAPRIDPDEVTGMEAGSDLWAARSDDALGDLVDAVVTAYNQAERKSFNTETTPESFATIHLRDGTRVQLQFSSLFPSDCFLAAVEAADGGASPFITVKGPGVEAAVTRLLEAAVAETPVTSAKYEWFGTVPPKMSERYAVFSLDQLEARAAASALVTVEESRLNLLPEDQQVPTPNGGGRPLGNTLTDVRVEKVYKSDGIITEGLVYTVIEYYTTAPKPSDPAITQIFGLGNVFPMAKGGEYLLFLDPPSHDYGDYEVFGLWNGQFKVSEAIRAAPSVDSLTKEELGAGRDPVDDPIYWGLAQEVKQKYIDPAQQEPAQGTPVTPEQRAQPYWEVDDLAALDTLLSNADGYIYYYIFDPMPPGLEVVRVGLPAAMDNYNITLQNPQGEMIQLFVFTLTEGLQDMSQFDQMVVDGTTYFYHQAFDENGECYVSYFQWVVDGVVVLVHPQEPITPDVVRKYNRLRKVEFNPGQPAVGCDTGRVLIADPQKVREVIRENEAIRFQTEGAILM